MEPSVVCCIALFFLGLASIQVQVIAGHAIATAGSPSPRLAYLGQYGDKTYYTGEGPYTWESARSICEQDGFTLIDVESGQEASYLISVLPQHFWTAGRESYYKFVEWYDSVNTGKSLPSFSGYGTAARNCAAFGKRNSESDRLLIACSTLFPALCQNSTTITSQLDRDVDGDGSMMSNQRRYEMPLPQ